MGAADPGQVLALPKGGGALQGLGETFSADPSTGTGQMSVPLPALPGRNGVRPTLALSYSSAGGNGHAGMGWRFGKSAIVRRTDSGVPGYDDQDGFELLGGPRLVHAGGEHWRVEVEEGAVRLHHVVRGNEDYWVLRAGDGSRQVFGGSASARVASTDGSRIFRWLLSEEWDSAGNRIVYEYKRDSVGDFRPEAPHDVNDAYLKYVYYADYADDPAGVRGRRWLYRLKFHYGDSDADWTLDPKLVDVGLPASIQQLESSYAPASTVRPDPFSSYRSGFEMRTQRRLWRVDLELLPQGVPNYQRIRSLYLGYSNCPYSQVSLLEQVQLVGFRAGATPTPLPPVRFEYAQFDARNRRYRVIEPGGNPVPKALSDPEMELVDLSGDGLPDVLELRRDGARWWPNLGDGTFESPRALSSFPTGLSLADPGTRLLDVKGDGSRDLLVLDRDRPGYYPTEWGVGWTAHRPFESAPSFDLSDPDTRLLDVDGDGAMDVLVTGGDHLLFFKNNKGDGFEQPRVIPLSADPAEGPAVRFSDPENRVRLADMTGDGLVDIVLVRSGRVDYWPNLGHGRFGRRITMRAAPTFTEPVRPERILLLDVTGNGCADVVYFDVHGAHLWVNQSGDAFSSKIDVPGVPAPGAGPIRAVDLLGTGAEGVLWELRLGAAEQPGLAFLDVAGGAKPYILKRIDNGMGLVTTAQYRPSTEHATRDRREGRPWKTALPFPLQVLERVEVEDRFRSTKRETRYRYHHGCWNGRRRELGGFGSVDEITTLDDVGFAARGHSRASMWFHTGTRLDLTHEWAEPPQLPPSGAPSGEALWALRGKALRTELWGPWPGAVGQKLLETTESTVRSVPQPGGVTAWRVESRETREALYEGGTEPRILSRSFEYDQYGNSVRETLKALGRNVPLPHVQLVDVLQAASFEVITETDYLHQDVAPPANDHFARPPTFLVDRPSEHRVHGAEVGKPHEILSRTKLFYDGSDFLGLGHPEAPAGAQRLDRGLLTSRLDLALTDGVLDCYGPRKPAAVAELTAHGGYYKDADGWWVRAARVAYKRDGGGNPQGGLVSSRKDPTGNQTRSAYDAYGLQLRQVSDPVGLTTSAVYDWEAGAYSEQTDVNQNVSRTAFDALGRVAASALLGKIGAGANPADPDPTLVDGDTLLYPTVRYQYDAFAPSDGRGPASTTVWERRHKRTAGIDTSADVREIRRYQDGRGEELQQRREATPAAAGATRWVSSPHTIANSHGYAVEVGRAAFVATGGFGAEAALTSQPRDHHSYDVRGRRVRTEKADGTVETSSHEPWRTVVHDANDNASRAAAGASNPNAAEFNARYPAPDATHNDTPTETLLDALGREVGSVRSTRDGTGAVVKQVLTRVYDLQDRVVRIHDPRRANAADAPTHEYRYDLLGRLLCAESPTVASGPKVSAFDAAGRVIWQRDPRGVELRTTHDAAGRPITVRDGGGVLRLRRVYRDVADRPAQARSANLLGRVEEVHDGTGRIDFQYDYRGNVIQSRRFVRAVDLTAGGSPWNSAWSPGVEEDPGTFSPHQFSTWDAALASFDAGLVFRYRYDHAGGLVATELPDGRVRYTGRGSDGEVLAAGVLAAGTAFDPATADLRAFSYNAVGQLEQHACSNGVATTRTIDPANQRVDRVTARRGASRVQEIEQHHDPVGNVIEVIDHLQDPLIHGGQYVPNNRTYAYDPIYQLRRATGRHHPAVTGYPDRQALGSAAGEYPLGPHPADRAAMRPYTHDYAYDAAGNFTRNGDYGTGTVHYKTGRVDLFAGGTSVGAAGEAADAGNYRYDELGNLVRSPRHQSIVWDHDSRLSFVDLGGGGVVRVLYGEGRERTMSLLRRNGRLRLSLWLDGFELHVERRSGAGPSTVISRIARLEVGGQLLATREEGNDPAMQPLLFYHHLPQGGVHVVMKGDGTLFAQEEFLPFGRSSDRRSARNKYRFHGSIWDDNLGLSWMGARTYSPVEGRFIQPDPAGPEDHVNPYVFVHNNPATLRDPSGLGFGDFLKGLALGIVTGLVIGLAILAAPITVPTALAIGLAVAGGAFVAYNTVQSIRHRDLLNRPISAEQAHFNLGLGLGGLVGGAAAGPTASALSSVGGSIGGPPLALAGAAGAGRLAGAGVRLAVATGVGEGADALAANGALMVSASMSQSGDGGGGGEEPKEPPKWKKYEDKHGGKQTTMRTKFRGEERTVRLDKPPTDSKIVDFKDYDWANPRYKVPFIQEKVVESFQKQIQLYQTIRPNVHFQFSQEPPSWVISAIRQAGGTYSVAP